MRAIVRAFLARAPFGSEIFLGRFFKINYLSLSLSPKFPNSSFLGKFKFPWDEDRIRSKPRKGMNWFAWRNTIDDDETLIQTEHCSRVSQRDSGSRPRPRERRVNSTKNRGGKTEESIYYAGVSGTELTWRIVNRSALDVSAIGSRGGKLYQVITYLVFDPVSDSFRLNVHTCPPIRILHLLLLSPTFQIDQTDLFSSPLRPLRNQLYLRCCSVQSIL